MDGLYLPLAKARQIVLEASQPLPLLKEPIPSMPPHTCFSLLCDDFGSPSVKDVKGHLQYDFGRMMCLSREDGSSS